MRRQPEAEIHRAVCQQLTLRAPPDLLWLHPANGGARDARTGAMLKRLGVLPGASDLLLWHRGEAFALEIKAPGGRPTEAQLEFIHRFENAGGYASVCEGIDACMRTIQAWVPLR